jgi:hypothetical protein
MPATKSHETGRERIASFESLDGAARAVSHLVELKYSPEGVAIAPNQFEVVAHARLLDRVRYGLGRGAAIGALTMGTIAVASALGVSRLVGSILPAVVAAAAVGACLGMAAAVVRHRRSSFMEEVSSVPQLRPTTFDVVVDRETEAARHDLASWWDPSAPPVQPSRVA